MASHCYQAAGQHLVQVTSVTDKDGGTTSLSQVQATITTAVVKQQGTTLVIGGTAASTAPTDDSIVITRGTGSRLSVSVNGTSFGTFSGITSALVFGQDGNDTVTVRGTSGDDSFLIEDSTVTINGLAITGNSVENWLSNGLAGNDDFRVISGAATIGGGAGTDTLIGPDATSIWQVTGSNAGALNTSISFTGIEKLTGGSCSDTFQFVGVGSVSGTIDGGEGSDQLDYSLCSSAVSVNLQSETATRTGGFDSIESLIGSSLAARDTLTGANAANLWILTAPLAGDINGIFRFWDVENLTGGIGTDDSVRMGVRSGRLVGQFRHDQRWRRRRCERAGLFQLRRCHFGCDQLVCRYCPRPDEVTRD